MLSDSYCRFKDNSIRKSDQIFFWRPADYTKARVYSDYPKSRERSN